jgi:hypothetical protein
MKAAEKAAKELITKEIFGLENIRNCCQTNKMTFAYYSTCY